MLKYLYGLLFVGLSSTSIAQIQVFSDDFEVFSASWISFESASPNYWISNSCAGNGSSAPGSNSLYVTPGGPDAGCGAAGVISYRFLNSDNGGSKSTVIAHQIVAGCAANLQVNFDYKISTDGLNDFAELVYSIDNGANWVVLDNTLASQVNFTPFSFALPTSLDNQTFWLGFRFTYNETSISGSPLAVDNFEVSGQDVVAPVLACPLVGQSYPDATCSALLLDYTPALIINDDCASTTFTVVQNPPVGTVVTANTLVEMLVTDEGGNQATCSFNVEFTDTIKPVLTCPEDVTVAIDASCNYAIPDLSSVVTVTDNCSSAGQFIFEQTPAINAIGQGITDVVLTVFDDAGNTRVCGIRLLPDDIVAPVLTCPDTITVNIGASCTSLLQDYSSQVVVVENCLQYDLVQTPAPNTSIPSGMHTISFSAQDEMGNVGQCSFTVFMQETIVPTISFCPQNVTTCNPTVTYFTPAAADNCGVTVTQTDETGFSSGDVFPYGTTDLIYTAKDPSGNTAFCNFSVTVIPPPSPAIISESEVSFCQQDTYTLEAAAITNGTGVWTQIAGTSTIENPTQPTTNVTTLSSGTNTFVWTVSSGTCGSVSDTIRVLNNPLPSQANAQTDTTFACDSETMMLLGNLPSAGTGLWSTVQAGVIENPTNHNTPVSGFAPGWNDFVYTITSGACGSTSDTISIYSNYEAEIFSNDTSLCIENDQMILLANSPVATQSAVWYFIQGQGEIDFPTADSSLVYDFNLSTNKIVYRFSHPICGFSYDTIQVSVSNCISDELVIPTMFTPNSDGKNDNFVIINLQENFPECDVTIVNRWGSKVYESVGYETPWDGTFNGESLPFGTYYYRINLNDGEKTSYSGPITLIR